VEGNDSGKVVGRGIMDGVRGVEVEDERHMI
jgi:hypothetical protein